MSRDPLSAKISDQRVLNTYLYAGGNPANYVDPRGTEDLFEYAIESSAAVPEAKLVSAYGCAANIILTGTSLILKDNLGGWDMAGVVGTTVGCLTINVPPASEAATKGAEMLIKLVVTGNYGFCGESLAATANDLNELVDNSSTAESMGALVDSLESLVSCVSTRLGTLLEDE